MLSPIKRHSRWSLLAAALLISLILLFLWAAGVFSAQGRDFTFNTLGTHNAPGSEWLTSVTVIDEGSHVHPKIQKRE